MTVSCIACDSQELARIGKLPVFTPDFLGKPINSSVDPGYLYACRECTLQFRWPQPQPEALLEYYRGLKENDWWQHGPEREVWRHVKHVVTELPNRSVLDVGCFRGDLLRYLGDGFSCFGVEPSLDARKEAENRGIEIIGDNIESLANEERRFGAITLIDVAEHLPKPLVSLRTLSKLLDDSGKLIIFTGSTDALSWQFARQDYWYCAMPEHVAFFRPSWFRWAASRLDCRLSSIKRLPYEHVSLRQRADEALKNISYVTYQRLKQIGPIGPVLSRLPIVKRIGDWQSCWWTSARDHILVIMTREKADPRKHTK